MEYLCTDAYATSTFLSEYYLNFRGQPRASVVPLDEVQTALATHPVDLAVNVPALQSVAWRPSAGGWSCWLSPACPCS